MDDCKNWRELYEAQQKKFIEYYESTIEEYEERLAAEKYELLLRQQELKLKIGDNIKVPILRDNYFYGCPFANTTD